MRSEPGHGIHLSYYDFGRTTVYACQADPRFSYCAYVPENYKEDAENRYALAVVVHGTDRGMVAYREHFIDFAEANDCIVLAPLFPVGIPSQGDLSNYKLIRAGDIRFDHVLLAMVEELARKYRVDAERFLLYGFSGGGHFAHRFFYLHPKRLAGVSIGAPGVVTLLDGRVLTRWYGPRVLEALPPVEQKLVRRNPRLGARNYFVGSHAKAIVGWGEAEGRALLDDLLARATRPEDIYAHRWQAGDLVIWDNRCLLHRGRPYDADRYRRRMRQTRVRGAGSTLDE